MKWEYEAVLAHSRNIKHYEAWLNHWGRNGWELIQIEEPDMSGHRTHIFKREKAEQLQKMQTVEPHFFANPTAY